jgi:hypothetical protein
LVGLAGDFVGDHVLVKFVGPNVGDFVKFVGEKDGDPVAEEGDLVGGGVGFFVVGALVGLVVLTVGFVVGLLVSPSLVGAADGL